MGVQCNDICQQIIKNTTGFLSFYWSSAILSSSLLPYSSGTRPPISFWKLTQKLAEKFKFGMHRLGPNMRSIGLQDSRWVGTSLFLDQFYYTECPWFNDSPSNVCRQAKCSCLLASSLKHVQSGAVSATPLFMFTSGDTVNKIAQNKHWKYIITKRNSLTVEWFLRRENKRWLGLWVIRPRL